MDEGYLQLIFGPMFSGKTTELLRRVKRYKLAQKNCIIIKYRADMRYGTETQASTHDRIKVAATPCSRLEEVKEIAEEYEVIGIDEGQFFPDIVEFCSYWSNLGKICIVAALDGTYQRKPFGRVIELISMAESVKKLSAVCVKCNKDAYFTKRTTNEVEVEVIGGVDKYIPLCRSCYNEEERKENLPFPVNTTPKKRSYSEMSPNNNSPSKKNKHFRSNNENSPSRKKLSFSTDSSSSPIKKNREIIRINTN
eukprot:TRINITY_DN5233_c0_g1_i1.p1 TRINITY_DN5233_c0_g1~~TRINITY_DN5233_c0_g1_i1.p1  ORF type:complete len:271 (+),score=88.41 TRINITY_DN5233_c0_g1_i1:60-815(+)